MFDSGFGGLTVARAAIDLMPSESFVYIGDAARYPYGNKPAADVARFARELATSLVEDHGAKMIVVACNTAASVALDDLRRELPVPVVGVVEPGARALVRVTHNGRVGVIGTVGTIESGAYDRAVAATGADVRLAAAACPGLVEFVERGQTSGPEVRVLAERLLAPVRDAGVDSLLLGCTHYPYLASVIGDVMGPDVVLVSSASETAFAIRDALDGGGLAAPSVAAPDTTARTAPDTADRTADRTAPRTGTEARPAAHQFLTSGDPDDFTDIGRRLFGPDLPPARHWARVGQRS
ncbi:MAG: glutamate racemase [Actinomycetota bacterium]